MKSLILNAILSFCVFWGISCTQNYNIDSDLKDSFTPKVVVNSIICPDSLIRVKCYWSRRYDEAKDFEAVEVFSGELREERNTIATFKDISGEILLDRYPVAGKTYELRITVPDYDEVRASTYVPLPPGATVSYKESRGGFMLYHHFNISAISQQEPGRAVWITTHALWGESMLRDGYTYYCNNPFLDQLNAANDEMDNVASGSNVSHDRFIRIPSKNICLAGDISFSFMASDTQTYYPPNPDPEDWDWSQREEWPLTYLYVNVIAPSDDYDKYFRSLYKQELYNYDPDMPLFDETVNVYSNIENGLGIFAGYSAATYAHKYETEEGEE